MEKALPVFLAGCMAGMGRTLPADANLALPQNAALAPDTEVDWDFLGE